MAAAVDVVIDHYELRGDGVALLLAQETTDPQVRRITDSGRRLHRDWVETVFAPYFPDSYAARTELIDLLAVATDVHTWRQLRRDRGLDRTTTTRRMNRLVSALLATTKE